jgi:AbrB family looped-hinge helix DNA binding protein
MLNLMKTTRISSGGQITVPAEIRKRWGTSNLIVEDLGDALMLRPVPLDPIGAAAGSLAGPGPTTDEMRARARREEVSAERRRLRALGR